MIVLYRQTMTTYKYLNIFFNRHIYLLHIMHNTHTHTHTHTYIYSNTRSLDRVDNVNLELSF